LRGLGKRENPMRGLAEAIKCQSSSPGSVQARLPGLQLDWLNSTFKQWSQLSPSSLQKAPLYSGTHGCGKSVIASSILQGLGHRHCLLLSQARIPAGQSCDSFVRSFTMAVVTKHYRGRASNRAELNGEVRLWVSELGII